MRKNLVGARPQGLEGNIPSQTKQLKSIPHARPEVKRMCFISALMLLQQLLCPRIYKNYLVWV